MKTMISKLSIIGFTSLVVLAGCSQEESVDVDNLLEEEDAFSFDLGESAIIAFQPEGMQILNAHSIPGDYPLPFEEDQLYEDYDIVHTDEILRIEADDTVYELEILGPRLFRDDESDLEFSTDIYLLGEDDQTG